ncbi:MAG: WecB/TagA/CpsF family glycosyltransferase [Spirochaetales bacterium]|nr:WecB/TagA/CpsF family glycosyltransferase [Spirochaetales bacterium]
MRRVKRINFLNVPVDIVDKETVSGVIEDFLQDNEKHHIVLLTVNRLLRGRFDNEYNRCLREASLVLPVASGIIRGIRFQQKGEATRYNPYEFIIRLFTLVEKLQKTTYLLGSHREDLMEAEKNLKVSFPDLKVIGRFTGYFKGKMETNVVLSIKKSSPSLLVVGKGVAGKEKWIFRNKKNFNPGIYIWIDNYFEIFSGREKNISKNLFKLGLESMAGFLRKPWKIFRIFIFIYFKLLVLVHRIMGY